MILARYVLVAHPLKRVGDLDEHARRRAAWQLCRRDCDGRVASPRSSGPASARRQAQSLSPFLAPFLLPFTLSCRCWCVEPVRSVFLSVPNARRVGIYKGLGTPLPIRAESVVACHGCTRSWHRWRFLWEVDSSRRAIDPGLGGAPLRRGVARSPRGAGVRTDRVARSSLTTGQGARHVGSSLAPAAGKSLSAVASCASSLPAAPRSDDANWRRLSAAASRRTLTQGHLTSASAGALVAEIRHADPR